MEGFQCGIQKVLREGSQVWLPWPLRMRRTLLPVTLLTWAIPCESLRITPICDGVRPFLASLQICSSTSTVVIFNHDGGLLLYGRADEDIPFLYQQRHKPTRHPQNPLATTSFTGKTQEPQSGGLFLRTNDTNPTKTQQKHTNIDTTIHPPELRDSHLHYIFTGRLMNRKPAAIFFANSKQESQKTLMHLNETLPNPNAMWWRFGERESHGEKDRTNKMLTRNYAYAPWWQDCGRQADANIGGNAAEGEGRASEKRASTATTLPIYYGADC